MDSRRAKALLFLLKNLAKPIDKLKKVCYNNNVIKKKGNKKMIIGLIEDGANVKVQVEKEWKKHEVEKVKEDAIKVEELAQYLFNKCSAYVDDRELRQDSFDVIITVKEMSKFGYDFMWDKYFEKASAIVLDMLKEAHYHGHSHIYCKSWQTNSGRYGYIYFGV